MDRHTRALVGIAAIVMAGGGLWWAMAGEDSLNGEVAIRVGILLGCVWLVAPSLRRPGPAAVGIGLATLLVVLRPRLVVAVVVGAVIWRLASRR